MKHISDGIEYAFSTRIPTNGEKSFQYLLLRLLLGTATFEAHGKLVSQTLDYSAIPRVSQSVSGASAVSAFLASFVGRTTNEFIRVTISDNRKFHQDVLAEFANYFRSTQAGSHTAAFVFLYRIQERIYFSVPLLYCSTMQDYAGTFKDLKKLFAGEEAGEHGLFMKFINEEKLIDPLILDAPLAIGFSGINADRHFKLAKRLFANFSSADPVTFRLEIKIRDVPELLRNVRNRFFHYRTGDGQANISLSEIQDTDGFFAHLNDVCCSFLSLVVLNTVAWKYQK